MTNLLLSMVAVCIFSACSEKETMPNNVVDNNKAIICLTYDDGMKTHYRNALPHLDSFGLKGTFFINNIPDREAVVAWRAASNEGHELGNHTLFHPCPRRFGWPAEVTTDFYTVEQLLEEIETVNSILNLAESKTRKRSFAYPCNNKFIGNDSYKKELQESGLVSYARSGGASKTIIPSTDKTIDFMEAPSWAIPEGTTSEELIDYAQDVVQQKGIGIIQFHGIGGEWLSVSNDAHIKLLHFLKANKSDVMVLTFTQLMEYLKEPSK